MKLVRLATLLFRRETAVPDNWELQIRSVICGPLVHWDFGDVHRLLVAAQVGLHQWPTQDPDGWIEIPHDSRREAESAIETSANLIALAQRVSRSIASPSPCIALLHESDEELAWLAGVKGFVTGNRACIPSTRFQIKLDGLSDILSDRLEGATLLAEALSHDHLTGRFHDLVRLFEHAFALKEGQLPKPLATFLSGSSMGYSLQEVNRWLRTIRGRATHAWKQFLLEADIRPVIDRMEQAAYDVLFNKAHWHEDSLQPLQMGWAFSWCKVLQITKRAYYPAFLIHLKHTQSIYRAVVCLVSPIHGGFYSRKPDHLWPRLSMTPRPLAQ